MKELHGLVAYMALHSQQILYTFIDYGSDEAASRVKPSEEFWSNILVSNIGHSFLFDAKTS